MTLPKQGALSNKSTEPTLSTPTLELHLSRTTLGHKYTGTGAMSLLKEAIIICVPAYLQRGTTRMRDG